MFSMDESTLYIGRIAVATIDYSARLSAALTRYSPVVAAHIAAGELTKNAALDLGRQIRLLL